MAIKRKDYHYDPSVFTLPSGEIDRAALEKEARRVAKQTNQRLLQLEKEELTSSDAYKKARAATTGYYTEGGIFEGGHLSKGRPRFKERTKGLSTEVLINQLQSMAKIQQNKTSTVGSVKKIYSTAFKNITGYAAESGVTISMNELQEVFEDEYLSAVTKSFGYKVLVQIADVWVQKHRKPGEKPEKTIDRLSAAVREAFTKSAASKNEIELKKALGITVEDIGIDPDAWIDV